MQGRYANAQMEEFHSDLSLQPESSTRATIRCKNHDLAVLDIDKNGTVSIKEASLEYKRRRARRNMAIISFVLLIAMTAYIFLWANPDKIKALESAMDICYITFGAIVATYLGTETWLEKR